MKHLFLCLVAFTFLLAACTHKKSSNAAVNKKLAVLLDQKDYFKLETQLKIAKDSLSDEKNLYFKSFIDNAFSRNEDCINDVDQLLKNYAAAFPDSEKVVLSRLKSDSYFKTYQYAKAAQNDNTILKQYARGLHKEDVDDIKNEILIRGALKNTPPQQTIIKNKTTILWKKNKINLIEIPIKCNGSTFKGIFDTRANISTITKTYAKKLGLHIIDVNYDESSGATGIHFKSGMGIADSIYIGDVLVKNVVFQVMDDKILYIAPIKFQLNMIIGFPVIAQLNEVDVYKDGKMTIPLTPVKSGLHNMALDGLDPVIALKVGNDILPFHFDSGAGSSDLYAEYFEKYKAAVLKNGRKKMAGYGGAGGIQKKEVYVLPSFNLTLGDKSVQIDSINVLTKKIVPEERYYGNIGQDFTGQFNEVIYNFKYMYIKGE